MTETAGGGLMLARLRRASGLSQNRLAHQSRIDPSYVNQLEHNTRSPHPSRAVILRLSSALGLDLAEGDRLLYAFGLAPCVDWQAAWEHALASVPGHAAEKE